MFDIFSGKHDTDQENYFCTQTGELCALSSELFLIFKHVNRKLSLARAHHNCLLLTQIIIKLHWWFEGRAEIVQHSQRECK